MNRNIYLYGISGIYNYGCEAMVRSISKCLTDRIDNCCVIYETYDYENDKRRLNDCTKVKVEAIRPAKRSFFQRGLRFLRRKLKIAKPEDYVSIRLDWLETCDLLIIIGGDVFDLTPTQKNKKSYDNDRLFVSEIAKRKGSKVALWGISIGNFESNIFARNSLLDYFKKIVDFGAIRDKNSVQFLTNYGINNIGLFADPAFIQRTVQTDELHKDVLGINLSPLANNYLRCKNEQDDWALKWADVISLVFQRLNYKRIYLIPHVVNQRIPSDDDLGFLKRVYEILLNRNLPVTLIGDCLGFLSIKPFLCECDLILSARMHCAINAITCGVPTVFLSYSPKSIGMCNYVYGNEKMVLDMNSLINKERIDEIVAISDRTDEIRSFLKIRNVELLKDAENAANILIRTVFDEVD